MKHVLFSALVGAAASLTAAHAADLPRSAPPPPASLPAFTWTGLYAGLNAGYAFTSGDSRGVQTGGFSGGGQIGYNYQLTPGSGFVLGVETDIQGLVGGRSSTAYSSTGLSLGARPSLDYFGTLRGRVGYAFDRTLVYATGGFAYGAGPRPSFPGSSSSQSDAIRTGFAAGAGVEYAFTEKLSAKVEALYVHLGRGATGTGTTGASVPALGSAPRDEAGFAVVRAGLNYRF